MRPSRHRLLVASTVLACYSAAAAQSVSVSIEPQPLDRALGEFVQQTGLQVLFPGNASTSGLVSPRIEGAYTADAVLSQLLQNSSLQYQFINARTVAIRSESAEDAPNQGHAKGAYRAEAQGMLLEASGGESDSAAVANADAGGGAESRGLPQILIRSSRSLNAAIERTRDDAQPYVVLDRKLIENSGASNVEDLLRTRLTMNYVPTSGNQSVQPNGGMGNESSIALRGLGSSQTLILIDGRRAGARGVAGEELQPDLNTIPLASIDRIEVLPATASGIYGGGATGGVINVVLRRDYNGLETSVVYGNTLEHGAANRRVDVNGGFNLANGRTSILVNASYSDTDSLPIGDRSFYARRKRQVYDIRQAISPQELFLFPQIGAATNVASLPTFGLDANGELVITSPNLVLKGGADLGSPITSGPTGGVADLHAALLANSGAYNLDPPASEQAGGTRSSILGAYSMKSIAATARQKVSSNVEAFLELSSAENSQHFAQSDLFPYFIVPADAPTNPFDQDVQVVVPLLGIDGTIRTVSKTFRALTGFTVNLSNNWSAALDYSFNRADARQSSPASGFSAQADTLVASGAIDVFGDPQSFAESFAALLLPANRVSPTHSTSDDAALRIAGPIATIPTGRITLSALLEYRDLRFGEWALTTSQPDGTSLTQQYSEQSSRVRSVYTELGVPLVSESHPFLGLGFAELQLSGRFDEYHLEGGSVVDPTAPPIANAERDLRSVDPTLGIRLRPLPGVMIRASYGTGFLPPALSQLQPSPLARSSGAVLNLRDPKRGNEVVGELSIDVGGNPNLDPEESESRSLGLVVTPTWLPGFRASLDWVKISKKDNITSLPISQASIDIEDALPGIVVRDSPVPGDVFSDGRIIGFNASLFNATHADSESFDIALDYVRPTDRLGTWTGSAAATRLMHNRLQQTPVVPVLENAGTFNSPKWSATASLGWEYQQWSTLWTARLLDSYWFDQFRTFDPIQNSDHISSQLYHDLSISYAFPEARGRGLLADLIVRLGLRNVFNTSPRLAVTNQYFYDTWSDPQRAAYEISFRKTFR